MEQLLKIQEISEEILKKHGIDPSAYAFFLKLRMPYHNDFVIGKYGEQILVGLQNGDLISDPGFAFNYNGRHWLPACSFLTIRRFIIFQGMFARNIREQGWLENGARVE